eukprot:TRINITY_DN11591_c0_g1_i2.p1 TRINITY_DN11591_c0_g1~~TRINITY_DN11591_c0_g1_i2.p1  ORF type:complete len:116 (+),score=26.85 TRINITY_DN11591_c0_g1_i2:107-454(+)
MDSGYICLSKILSSLNIIFTFVGMCIHLFLITAQFGAGDSSSLQVIVPIVICIPMFILSASFAICFLHCFCCRVNTEMLIFNSSDPENETMNNEHNVVPKEVRVQMEEMNHAEKV